MIGAPTYGWASALVIAALAAGALALAAFVLVEGRTPNPLLPLALFRSTQFTATNLVTFLVYAALGGALFLLPIQLEQVAHYSPFEAGTSLLPLTALMLIFSARSGGLAARIGPRAQMTAGPVVVGAGMVLFRLVGPSGSYLTEVLPAILVLGAGLALTVAPLTTTALSSAPAAHAGVASAVNNDVARAGGLVAVALLPVLSGITGASYLHPQQLSAGFRTAAAISGAAAAAGGLLAAGLIRNPRRPAPVGTRAVGPPVTQCGLEAPALAVVGGPPAGTTPGAAGATMGA